MRIRNLMQMVLVGWFAVALALPITACDKDDERPEDKAKQVERSEKKGKKPNEKSPPQPTDLSKIKVVDTTIRQPPDTLLRLPQDRFYGFSKDGEFFAYAYETPIPRKHATYSFRMDKAVSNNNSLFHDATINVTTREAQKDLKEQGEDVSVKSYSGKKRLEAQAMKMLQEKAKIHFDRIGFPEKPDLGIVIFDRQSFVPRYPKEKPPQYQTIRFAFGETLEVFCEAVTKTEEVAFETKKGEKTNRYKSALDFGCTMTKPEKAWMMRHLDGEDYKVNAEHFWLRSAYLRADKGQVIFIFESYGRYGTLTRYPGRQSVFSVGMSIQGGLDPKTLVVIKKEDNSEEKKAEGVQAGKDAAEAAAKEAAEKEAAQKEADKQKTPDKPKENPKEKPDEKAGEKAR